MTLTERAFSSTPTAHLAQWRGGPSISRVLHLQRAYLYDSGDVRRGRKIGKTYGCLYHITPGGLIPVEYDGHRMIEAGKAG